MRQKAFHDTVWGGLFLLLAVFMFWASTRVAAASGWYRHDNLTFPRIVVLILAVSSALLMATGLRQLRRLAAGREDERTAGETAAGPVWGKLLATGIFYAVYVAAVSWLGFVFATILMIAGNMRLLGERLGPRMLVVALATTIGFVLLFARLVGVDFPRGVAVFRQWSLFLY